MTRCCTDCGRQMHASARNPVCITCRSSRTCMDCDTPVSYASKGRCRICAIREMVARPGHAERQSAAITEYNRRPENAGVRREAALKGAVTKRSTPDGVRRMAENGRKYGRQNIVLTRSPASRAKAGVAISATKLRRVPAAYVDLYRELRRGNTKAADALRMVLEQQRTDEDRRVAAMSPFERQLERVRNGAAIVIKPTMPSRVHDFTLGGVSGGML